MIAEQDVIEEIGRVAEASRGKLLAYVGPIGYVPKSSQEDVIQEAFYNAMTRAGTYVGETVEGVELWLFGILGRTRADLTRQRRIAREEPLFEDDTSLVDQIHPGNRYEQEEAYESIVGLLERYATNFPRNERTVLEILIDDAGSGKSQAALAREHGITEDVFYRAFDNLKRKLRSRLQLHEKELPSRVRL